jgi:hypothetical protein
VRIYATRWFARFVRREGITDADLREAVRRAERGLVDADLGGGVLKQRSRVRERESAAASDRS